MKPKPQHQKFLHQMFQRISLGGRIYSSFVIPSLYITHLRHHFWAEIEFLNDTDLLILADFDPIDLLRVSRLTKAEILVISSRAYPEGLVDHQFHQPEWDLLLHYFNEHFLEFSEWSKKPKISGHGKALFLDRDGVLVENVDYNSDPSKITFKTDALDWIKKARDQDYFVFVITNQSGLGRKYFSKETYLNFERELQKKLIEKKLFIDRTYYCGNFSESEDINYQIQLQFRKPRPGMLKKAVQDYQLDLKKSIFIGDQVPDIQAALLAGVETCYLHSNDQTKIEKLQKWRKELSLSNDFKLIENSEIDF